MNLLLLVSIAIIILIFISLFLAWILCNVVIKPEKKTIEETLKYEFEHGYITPEEYENFHRVPFHMTNQDGNKIEGEWILPGKETERIVVIAHGYTANRTGSYKYVSAYLKRGFKVLVYDHCNCGLSYGKYTTMGYQESKDLEVVISEVIKQNGENCIIGTHGESMGAATVILHACKDDRVKFVVADCPYADLKEQLAYRMKVEYHLPEFPILQLASLLSKLRSGFYFGEISPIHELEKCNGLPQIPILFVHGLSDDYIPYQASERLANKKRGISRLYLCENANHAESFKTDPILYEEELDIFLGQVLK